VKPIPALGDQPLQELEAIAESRHTVNLRCRFDQTSGRVHVFPGVRQGIGRYAQHLRPIGFPVGSCVIALDWLAAIDVQLHPNGIGERFSCRIGTRDGTKQGIEIENRGGNHGSDTSFFQSWEWLVLVESGE
jgi:hypothetical protein